MEKVLIDSSVWIDYFRGRNIEVAREVDQLLDEDRVALCGMVELEILQGLRDKERQKVKDLFAVLHFVEAERDDFIVAGECLSSLRQKGITIPASDCLIAMQCHRRDILLFSLDSDFDHIAELLRYYPKN